MRWLVGCYVVSRSENYGITFKVQKQPATCHRIVIVITPLNQIVQPPLTRQVQLHCSVRAVYITLVWLKTPAFIRASIASSYYFYLKF